MPKFYRLILCTALAVLAACAPLATPIPAPQIFPTGTPQGMVVVETQAVLTPAPGISATPTSFLPASPTSTPLPLPTATQPEPTAEPVRFAVIGDFGGNGPPERDVSELVKSWEPDFVITTGDNNYPDGSEKTIDHTIGQYYSEFIFPYRGQYGEGASENRFFPTLGNHDWQTNQAQPYLDYFELPGNERYYDFTWGPVHFFALDSDSREPDGVSRLSDQAMWLKEKLAASTSPWKIIYMHHPPYSSGLHGPIDWMRWPFREWGASAVLAGHDHTYERLIVDGLPYFVNGLGGGAVYYFETISEGSQVRYNDDYGAMLVFAEPEQLYFQFITRQGEVIDTYALEAN